MGIEFIRWTSGKPYTKRWAGGRDRLRTPALLDVRLSEASRTLTARLAVAGEARPGSTVVQMAGRDLVVLDGLRQIACIHDAPAGVRAALADRHGMASAVVERVGALGGTAEIRLK